MRLRDALDRTLAGWKEDLPAAWLDVLAGVELCFESRALNKDLWPGEQIIPSRRTAQLAGAPPGAHVFRAFDGLDPASVRAVILGQDPYPNPSWATGRAFEQGNLTEWPEQHHRAAHSLARVVQVLAFARTKRTRYIAGNHGWDELMRDVRAGRMRLEAPRALFDHLERQGVLFLNASLTLSLVAGNHLAKQRRSHFPLWRPLVFRVLAHIARRPNSPAIFLLWGKPACDVFEHAGIQAAAESAGTWETRVEVVRHFHPAAITSAGAAFLQGPNPFLSANRLLHRMGATPIEW